MDIKELCVEMDWIYQDRDQQKVFVNRVMNARAPGKVGTSKVAHKNVKPFAKTRQV
jgi:hypothetical protein